MKADKERMQILKMLEEKKITAEEAADLLSSLEAAAPGAVSLPGKNKSRWLRVRVRSEDGDRVEVNLPVSLIRVAKHFLSEINIQGRTIQVDDLEALIADALEAEGKMVEVESAAGDHVEIFVD
ncbi:MAG: hypothetical protein QJR00_00535 [Bacillota bacterium]|nr:hypothetical protein [Bacillota bacterium]